MGWVKTDEEGLIDNPCLHCSKPYREDIWGDWCCDEKCPHETEFVNDALQIVPWKDCECVEFRYQNEYGKKTFRIISLGMLFLNGNKREDVNKFVFDMIGDMRRELND